MTIGYDFAPDGARAQRLNARMHAELAASLRHVCEQIRGVLWFDEPALDRLVARLAEGVNYPAGVFARYYELVAAILESDGEEAERLLAELAAARPLRGLAIQVLGEPGLGEESARYIRMMNADGEVDIGFGPPDPTAAAAFRERLGAGLTLLRRGVPELAGEFDAIVREVVISGGDTTKPLQFDGGSHYQLWGALFLNCQFHPDPLAVVEVLAHESAHSLLFGFCTREVLVENDDDERYASPLRTDLRPMDGIYHATFVSARMHWAMSRITESGVLDAAGAARARAAADADLVNFRAGYGVVAEHGRLTPLGERLMDQARSYMDAQG